MINEALFAANSTENTLNDGHGSISIKVYEIFEVMKSLWGSDYVNTAIEKAGVSELAYSNAIENRIFALQKLILKEDRKIEKPLLILERIQLELAKIVAKQQIKDKLQFDVDKLLEEKQSKLLDELKLSIINKHKGPENSATFKKLVDLQKLEAVKLSGTIMEHLRPGHIKELVGQRSAVDAMLSKLATPYPQHMILYGPPGVGKTTSARLALGIAKELSSSCFKAEAPFIEVDGTTLRWDKGEATNPLIGSVHDPIYQGSKRDFAEMGIPEPKPGLVTSAHGGILFIDEIGEIDPMLQNKLLKVLEDKKVEFSSSYYDKDDVNVPAYIKKMFNDGVPADFILIGATTRQPHEINPALRSRCAEVYFDPLTKKNIEEIVSNAAEKLDIKLDMDVPSLVSEYTIEGRKAVNILSDAFGNAVYKSKNKKILIKKEDVLKSVARARLIPINRFIENNIYEVGRVNGLGVSGFIGSILEIEAVAFAKNTEAGSNSIRFNDTAGSMARDSVFNAASVIRILENIDVSNYDVHVNVIGGANVDGPSAGAAITVAILSAVTGKPVRQNVAITGEISLRGNIKPVGGIIEKIYGAEQAGISTVIIPYENRNEIPEGISNITIIPVKCIKEITDVVFEK